MRRVIVSNMMSLDGMLDGPQRELDWHGVDEEFFGYAREMLRSVDAILFGRTTYAMMAAYWPAAPRDEIADKMNGLPKIVFSKSLAAAEWANTTLVRGDSAAEVARLKQQPGKDLAILGSGALASSLLQAGLIDEYRALVNPVVLGGGTPLFQNIRERIRLRLNGVRQFGSGVVMLTYQPL